MLETGASTLQRTLLGVTDAATEQANQAWVDASQRDEAGPDLIREQLERILSNPQFDANERRRRFLKFVVSETLAGKGDRLKGFVIAVEAFDRDDSFDPQADPVVRLEARRLRRELERYYLSAGREDPVLIEIPKGTYRPVFRILQITDPAKPGVSPPNDAGPPASPQTAGAQAVLRSGRRLWSMVAVACLVGATVLGILWHQAPTLKQSAHGGAPAIVVLPFSNLSHGAEHDYIAKGMTVDVINELYRFDDLVVVSPEAAIGGDAGGKDLRTIARDFAVNYVLTGTAEKSGGKLHVTVRLLDTQTSVVRWMASYDLDLQSGNIINLRKSIASAVARGLAQRNGVFFKAGLPTGTMPRAVNG